MLTSTGTLVSRARTAATARRQSWSGAVTAASQTSASTVTATVWLLSLSMFRNFRCPRERRQRLLVRLDGLSRRHLVCRLLLEKKKNRNRARERGDQWSHLC